jgi:hypothetical protein
LAGVGTAAETVAAIAAVAAVGDAVVDANAADARRVAQAGAIFLHRNMHRHKAASPADLTIVADNRALTTIGVRKLRASRRLPRQASPRKRSFFPVNRWQNIVASLPSLPHLFPLLSMKHMKSKTTSKKSLRAQAAICLPPPRAAAAFLAGSPGGYRAGSWLMPALKQKQHPREKLLVLPVRLPFQTAPSSSLRRRRLLLTWKPRAMTLN